MKSSNQLLFSILITFFAFNMSAQSPNILLIIADDVGVGEIPSYPPSVTKANMPHLETMIQEGLTFDNVWSNPVCSPSRANILTGKYGLRTNVLNPQNLSTLDIDETSLHEYIDQSSNGLYSSSLIGKWHLGGSGMNPVYDYPNELGIDYFAGLLGGGVGDYNNYEFVENQQGTNSNEYVTTKITDTAIDWIDNQTQPWFCWLAYNAPHTPLHLPPLNMHSQGDLPTDQASIDTNPQPYFLAMIESVDYEMGRLFDNIPADELANTIIIFVGDNGTSGNVIQAPYQTNRAKGSLYQGGVHVPMVITGAGVSRINEREAALVSFSDLFSTIVEMTGTSLSQIHDSFSFFPLLSTTGEGQRDCAYTEVSSDGNSDGWAARNATYKYIELDNGGTRFYNLINDPYEQDNLLTNLNQEEQAAFDKLSAVRDALTPVNNIEVAHESFQLFPNPAQKDIQINWDYPHEAVFYILDAAQKRIQKGILTFGENTISVEGLTKGIYFIQVGGVVKRFVKV
ncbi:MAG: arylsulfatase A-like enzyme [Paraglaciecola sp.]|jgi:arylsulfatase A-like enzyme